MKPHPKNVGDHLYVAVLLPFDRQMKIDEAAYRSFLQYFLKNEKFVRMGGGLCINPEAGEIFYLTRQEKRRVLEIAMEEVHGKVPIIAGTWAITTDETVETASDCKALGVDGIFVTPPGGAQDVTSCWDADNYPEIWLDQIIAQDRAVDLPIVTHPVGGAKPPFYPGLPLEATLRICREVPNVVGWKMTYMYDGFRMIANGLRGLDHHVAVMGALASRFHEYKATGMFDGTLSGFWNFALEPMLDHLEAWDAKDIDKARADLGRRPRATARIRRRHGPPAHPLQDGDLAARADPQSVHALADAEAEAAGSRHAVPAPEKPGGAGDRQQGNSSSQPDRSRSRGPVLVRRPRSELHHS